MRVRTSDRRRPRGQARRLAALLLGAVLLLGSSPARAALPVIYFVPAAALAIPFAETPPPGANNWACRPTAAHPRPVVLVHGTFAHQNDNFLAVSPLLVNSGYCVFTFNYGGPPLLGIAYGLGDIATSAGQLGAFVDQVLATTGTTQVDIVGHSQGGMMPRYYINSLGGAPKVGSLIGLAPSNKGTTAYGLATLGRFFGVDVLAGIVCPSCAQQYAGSTFLNQLNASGGTVATVKYTVIASRFDEVITPYNSSFLPAGPNVRNITLQDGCWLDFSGHIALVYDHIALRHVLNPLDPAHPVNPGCSLILFGLGG